MVWWRLAWSQRGEIGMGTADSNGFVSFFAINFCLLGLDGVCVGFGLVGSLGWVGIVGSGGGLVGNRLFGCFCYRLLG